MNDTPGTIDQYLAALRRAFGHAPAGLIADALADAEEHLRGAMAAHPGQSEADAIRSYGSAADVAAEYLASESRPAGPFQPPPSRAPGVSAAVHRPYPGFFGVIKDPVTYGALFYMLLAGVLGGLYFAWATIGVALSLGLFILIIGIPFFLIFVGSVRTISYVEGRIIELLLGVRMPRRLWAAAPNPRFRDRIREALADRRTWSSLLYMLLMLPLGITYCTIAGVGLAAPVLMVYFGFWYMLHLGSITLLGRGEPGCDDDCTIGGYQFHEVPGGGVHLHNTDFPWLGDWALTPVPGLLTVLTAVLVFFLTLHLARLIGWLHGRIAEHLLVRL